MKSKGAFTVDRFKFFVFVLIFQLLNPADACAVKISVLEPGELECVMEAGRDFYVIGRIDREGRSAAELPVDIRVEVAVTGLVRAGEKIPIREVRSRVDKTSGVTPSSDIYFGYGGRAPWVNLSREELMKSPPPDLVYRHGVPESFYNPSVKAVVMENTFAVLVQGGVSKDFDTDYNKIYGEDLQWKLYRVFVDAMSGDEVLDSCEFDVMFGTQQEKALTSLLPEEHLEVVRRFASPLGIRIYKNLFPGYWDFGLGSAYEIPMRSRRNRALEFLEGRVHAIIYNISEDSVEQRIELGQIAFQGWLDTDEVYFYRYDVGEPSITYEKYGEILRRDGVLTRFEERKRLKLTRVEVGASANIRHKYFPFDNVGRAELYPVCAVILKPGETLRVCGAVAPLQPMPQEVLYDEDDATFSILNRIDKIRYIFEDTPEGILHEEEHKVGLARFYEEYQSISIYEFRHALELSERLRGRIVTVRTEALDRHGEPVSGTEEAFFLYVRE